MAVNPQHLHLAEVTAAHFITVWERYDRHGNGFIKGKDLGNFFRELEAALRGTSTDSANGALKEKIQDFLKKFEKDAEEKIEMSELAQVLPAEENFLLCFRQFLGSSVKFMTVWRTYDTDRSGFIESNELKNFLSDLLKKANRHYDDKKMNEYTQTILKMFDLNNDGKLGLSEMARLLPVQENFLLKFQGFRLSPDEFGDIFTFYDKDGNGYIDEQELDALLKDLYQKHNMKADPDTLATSKQSIMSLSDGGKLFRAELEIVLCKDPTV
ncbi:calretinin-like [Clarias gariepinus]|uniref:calretinin-like n=1 Tax=Clarias gariepinus TaxID=13013 RepID=UPI00234C5286|nr:calretinin-like [Clarias gariepinus]